MLDRVREVSVGISQRWGRTVGYRRRVVCISRSLVEDPCCCVVDGRKGWRVFVITGEGRLVGGVSVRPAGHEVFGSSPI
jgi:hypothetical protein